MLAFAACYPIAVVCQRLTVPIKTVAASALQNHTNQ
jgi:hypothetical protein